MLSRHLEHPKGRLHSVPRPRDPAREKPRIQSPSIVFDDVINAIDQDHRGRIRQTIFESDYVAQTQLVVTCHSN